MTIAGLTIGGLLLLAAPAVASQGVAIDLGRIEIEQKLRPGASYRLPVMGVRNTGTERTRYELHASALQIDGRDAPPEDWFHFSPAKLTLNPGETRRVKMRIEVPPRADPGDYAAVLQPKIVTGGVAAQVGAAAASRVTFSVEPASWLQAWWLNLKSFFAGKAPWPWLLAGLVLMSPVAWRLRSRFAFRSERRT